MGQPAVAVVTGASRGIGAATARRLAAAGMQVHLLARSAAVETIAAQIRAEGGQAQAYRVDMAEPQQIAVYAAQLDADDVPVEVLVNNAACIDDALIPRTTLAQWERVLAVNLTGPFLLTQALVPLMMDRRRGSIINVSSRSAAVCGPGQAAYAASKGGLESFTRACAAELQRYGIRANAVQVGRVRTQLSAPVEEQLDAMGSQPWAEPEDIADIIAFLAGPESRYLNGQVLTADGGVAVTRPRGARP